MLPDRAALFGAVCYAANPNALLMIYFRSDYAELLASAFFPLLFLAAFQASGILPARTRSQLRTLAYFSATIAAVWLSNAPAGVLATYTAMLLFVWAAASEKSWRPLARGSAGLALGLGLAGFYLVPAAYEQRWVNIGQALSAGLLPSQNFLYTAINDPEHNFFNLIASTIAVITIGITGLAAIAARQHTAERSPQPIPERLWQALIVMASAATLLMLRPTSILWQLLPQLRFVQFPWRWMSILSLPLAYFLAAAVLRGRFRWVWITTVLAVFAGIATLLVRHTWWDPDDLPTLQEAVAKGEGLEGTDEYDPIGDDRYNLPANAPRVQVLPAADTGAMPLNANIYIDRWTAEEKEIRVKSREPILLALRLVNYPAWQVDVNGEKITPARAEDSGQMIVPVPAGESRIVVRFIRTKDRIVGALLSALSLVVMLFLLRRPSKKTEHPA
jgi:hypothetical protein